MKSALKTAPKVDRFSAAKDPEAKARVDRTGGRYGAGLIAGVSLCSRGEALGHYMWIDDVMLQSIVDNSPTEGPRFLKSRFTHPDWCSDGMGKALGTIEAVNLAGDQVYGDLHFYGAAHNAPDGDLAGYVMDLADEDPANFGLSIVFAHDWEAEDLFEAEHTEEYELKDDSGEVVSTRKRFVSPDPLNVENLPHARLRELRAADVVDEPAANPKGLFHRENSFVSDGSKLLDFVLGRSAEAPALSALGVDVHPDRVKSFVSKYLAKAGLSLTAKEGDMPLTKSKLAEDPKDEEKPADNKPAEDKPKEDPPKETAAGEEKTDDDSASADDKSKCSAKPDAELSEYCTAFGHEAGAKFFLAGTSFKAAQNEHIASLTASLNERDDKLAAFAKLGVEPVGFTAAADKKRDETNKSSASGNTAEEIDNWAKFAALNADVVEKK